MCLGNEIMIEIIFESHGTTLDNENHRASGYCDVALSLLGEKQARELGMRYAGEHIDAVFCSDLQRSYRTAELAFEERNISLIKDIRLRECDYGDLTRHSSREVDAEKPQRISTPFPHGESYEQTTLRIKSFLDDLWKNYDGKRIMIIGHRATQYGLEHWIEKVPLTDAISASWKWQPGWRYYFTG